MPVTAQEVTWLGDSVGRVARDAQGNWFTVVAIEQNAGNRDLRVQKFNPDFTITFWSRAIGGTGSEEIRAILADPGGSILLLGDTSSKDPPVTAGVLAPTAPEGPSSAFLMKLDPAGEVAFSTYLHDGTGTHAENLLQQRGDEIVLALTGRVWRLNAIATRRTSEVLSPWIGGLLELDSAAAEGRVASLGDLAVANEMLSFPHDLEMNRGWRTAGALQTSTHPVVSEKAQEMLHKENKELSGVLSTANTALALYSDPLVARNTAASDFTIKDLVNYERPSHSTPPRP